MSVDEADLIAGMTPTGRRLATPAAELVEAQDARGLKHLVWRAQDVHRTHPALTADLQIGWMENPEVTGLARLVHHDPDEGTFAYATGTCFTIAEIVRIYAEEETGAGVKAGLELCYLVAEALSEAAEGAFDLGVFSHGNLNPWTIVVKPDGQPLVLCYGLPQVEMRVWQEDPREVPREDSFRYAPPERLEGHDEDIASDLFALALIGLELMVGRPVYDGLLDDIRQQASRGEGMRRLYQWREKLPANVREVLGRALKPDPDTRYRRGLDFVYAVHDLLGSIDVEGPSLVEVMAKVRAVTKRGKGPIIGGKTGMLSAEELRELAADIDEIDEKPLPPPRAPRPEPEPEEGEEEDDESAAPRWQRRRGSEPEAPPDPKAKARDRLKRRLRRSSGTATGDAPTAEEGNARDRLRRRLRGSEGGSNDEAPRRRRRRGGSDTSERKRRRRETEASAASQSIDLGDPLGFDEDAESTDIDLAPVSLPDLPDEIDEPEEPEVGRVVAAKPEEPEEPDAPEEAETQVSNVGSSGGAAALLQRLRGSTGERRRRRSRSSGKTPAPAKRRAAPEVASPNPEPAPAPPAPELPAPAPPEEGSGEAVAMRRPAERPKPPTAPPPPPPPRLEPTAEELEPERVFGKRRPPGFSEPEPGPRLPESDFLDDDDTAGETPEPAVPAEDPPTEAVGPPAASVGPAVGGMAVVAPDGREVVIPVDVEECIASVVRRAVARLGLQRVDLEGRPVVGWRGRVGDHPLPGATVAQGIERLELLAEPRSDHRLVVEHGGHRIHLSLPSCVAVGAVLPALAALFGVDQPLRPSFGGRKLPGSVLVGELRRKPLVLEADG